MSFCSFSGSLLWHIWSFASALDGDDNDDNQDDNGQRANAAPKRWAHDSLLIFCGQSDYMPHMAHDQENDWCSHYKNRQYPIFFVELRWLLHFLRYVAGNKQRSCPKRTQDCDRQKDCPYVLVFRYDIFYAGQYCAHSRSDCHFPYGSFRSMHHSLQFG